MFSGCSEINVSTSDYNEQSRALADLIYLAQKLSSSLAAFNQRFDQFYHEQTDPNVLVQDFPAYLDPYYSTYRSLGGWNFNFMKVIPFNVFTSTLRPSRFWSGFPCWTTATTWQITLSPASTVRRGPCVSCGGNKSYNGVTWHQLTCPCRHVFIISLAWIVFRPENGFQHVDKMDLFLKVIWSEERMNYLFLSVCVSVCRHDEPPWRTAWCSWRV